MGYFRPKRECIHAQISESAMFAERRAEPGGVDACPAAVTLTLQTLIDVDPESSEHLLKSDSVSQFHALRAEAAENVKQQAKRGDTRMPGCTMEGRTTLGHLAASL